MNKFLERLQDQYGLLMTIDQLAVVLCRKPAGLRSALQMSNERWVCELNRVKRRIGRRVYFPTESVAALLNGEFGEEREQLAKVSSNLPTVPQGLPH
ncbi:hypothetical protein D9M68_779690 [compost metagenome]